MKNFKNNALTGLIIKKMKNLTEAATRADEKVSLSTAFRKVIFALIPISIIIKLLPYVLQIIKIIAFFVFKFVVIGIAGIALLVLCPIAYKYVKELRKELKEKK